MWRVREPSLVVAEVLAPPGDRQGRQPSALRVEVLDASGQLVLVREFSAQENMGRIGIRVTFDTAQTVTIRVTGVDDTGTAVTAPSEAMVTVAPGSTVTLPGTIQLEALADDDGTEDEMDGVGGAGANDLGLGGGAAGAAAAAPEPVGGDGGRPKCGARAGEGAGHGAGTGGLGGSAGAFGGAGGDIAGQGPGQIAGQLLARRRARRRGRRTGPMWSTR